MISGFWNAVEGNALYRSIEQSFWNSLRKKLSSFMLLFVIDLLYVLVVYFDREQTRAILQAGQVAPEIAAQVLGRIDHTFNVVIGLAVIAFVFILLMISYLGHVVAEPINTISRLFREIGAGGGDLSRDLPLSTYDEIRTLSESYNSFLRKLREIIADIRKMSVSIAVDAVRVARQIRDSSASAGEQDRLSATVFHAS